MAMPRADYGVISEKLLAAGLRPTRQRLLLGSLLFVDYCRHVTAEMLHREVRASGAEVSLATVYNTLHQFKAAGLLGEVVMANGRTCFDTNLAPHHHFMCKDTNALTDIAQEEIQFSQLPQPPSDMYVDGIDVVIRLKPAKVA